MATREEQIAALNDARQIQLEEYRSASSAVLRYQVTRLLFMLLIVALALGQNSLLPVGAEEPKIALDAWLAKTKDTRSWLLQLPYADFSKRSEAIRREITDVTYLHVTPKAADTMSQVYGALVRSWGFDPIRLPELEALLLDLGAAGSEKPWNDVKAHKTGANDATLEQRIATVFEVHPYVKVPIPDGATVGQIIDSLVAARVANIDAYRMPSIAFQSLDARLPSWRNWSWEAWDGLRDQDFDEWKSGVLATFGTIERTVEKSIDRNGSVASAIDVTTRAAEAYAKAKQMASVKKAQNDDVTLSLFSINIDLPQAVLLLVFCLSPMLFALSVALLRMLQLRQRLTSVELARVETRLSQLVGHEFVGATVDPEVMTPRVGWDYLRSREWAKLFQNDPELFTDFFFTGANIALVTILVTVVVHVATGLHDYPKLFVLMVASMLGLAVDAVSRRVEKSALHHGLRGAASVMDPADAASDPNELAARGSTVQRAASTDDRRAM